MKNVSWTKEFEALYESSLWRNLVLSKHEEPLTTRFALQGEYKGVTYKTRDCIVSAAVLENGFDINAKLLPKLFEELDRATKYA